MENRSWRVRRRCKKCAAIHNYGRQTQYDFYFTDMTTTEAEGYDEIKGEPLWDYMASKAQSR